MNLIAGEPVPLSKRAITQVTCEKWDYHKGTFSDRPVQIANYRDAGGLPCAQKIRFADKTFKFIGDPKSAVLYGQHLWAPGGKMVVVTEGEIDALSMSQVQDNKWPVVSLKNGASGAKKDLQGSLEWLESFETVILMFDMDEPGQKAAQEAAALFSPGKVRIAKLPLKDANEMLVAGRVKELIQAMWNAQPWRPDGIVSMHDLRRQVVEEEVVHAIPYPWYGLTAMTHGQRLGELVTWTAGSGIGKSAIVSEIAYDLITRDEPVGMLMLEHNVRRAALNLLSVHMNIPLRITRSDLTPEEIAEGFDGMLKDRQVYLYDHFGSTEIDNLLAKVRYMARGLGVRWVILDHLSIVVSGLEGDDERRLIDRAMTQLRTLVEDTGIGLHLVSHLKRPDGKGHEEGAQTSLSQLRGSAAIGQLSDMVIGLERDQQGDDPNLTTVRVLKNRFSGDTGVACGLRYDPITGRLSEADLSTPASSHFKDETKEDF